MKNIAIIPARGGSKRIPGKNIKSFMGKPIIAYSIETALQTNLFDEVMVSTDDEEIARIALQYGAKVPFIRSSQTAGDFATLADVLSEVIDCYREKGTGIVNLCCILPTAPLLRASHIESAYKLFEQDKLTSVCPVVEFSYPILRALKLDHDNKLRMIWPEHLQTRSQDLPKAYHDSGTFYWVNALALKQEGSVFTQNGSAIILSEDEVQDIDTETDWHMAELKYSMRGK